MEEATMSFNRRWLLTAAGSALVASAAGFLEAKEGGSGGKGKAPIGKKTGILADDETLVFENFVFGYRKAPEPGGGKPFDDPTPPERAEIRKVLRTYYGKRFDKKHGGMPPKQFVWLEQFASTLGFIAGQSLLLQRKGGCGWGDAVPDAKLGEDHVEFARDVIGFVLNSRLRERLTGQGDVLCYEAQIPGLAHTKEVDQPCPLCDMSQSAPPKVPGKGK
jgi:hypothetical protein